MRPFFLSIPTISRAGEFFYCLFEIIACAAGLGERGYKEMRDNMGMREGQVNGFTVKKKEKKNRDKRSCVEACLKICVIYESRDGLKLIGFEGTSCWSSLFQQRSLYIPLH